MQESDLLTGLNDAQSEAVTTVDGPLLILAGAGSGKTRVITRRVAYLLHLGVHPKNILAITFTNKAAGEMKQRVSTLVPGHRVWISTFHALGARLLRQYADDIGIDRNFTIYDQTDRVKVVKMAMEDAQINAERFSPDSVMNAISKAKNQLLAPDRYAAQARDFFANTVAKVYPIYEKRLHENSALDFDDLLYWPAMVLKNNQELRQNLDARFKYVLVDEYQDTNQAQYTIAKLLSQDHPNLCVVGDPDQSIYKFRGSDIRNILDFERDYPNARTLTLSLNYRSTKAILAAASALISNNRQRKPKDLLTENAAGQKVGVSTYASGLEEADGIARKITEAVNQQGRHYRDFAILVRINALTRSLEQAMVKYRVPFQIVRGLAFFDRKENRDVLAYLRLLMNPKDDISFERVINEPARGIGATTIAHLRTYAQNHELSLLAASGRAEFVPGLKGKGAKAVGDFAAMMRGLEEIKGAQPDEVIRQVLDQSGYREMLRRSKDEDDNQRLANIEELITGAAQMARDDPQAGLTQYLENVTLTNDIDGLDTEQDCVSIMTLHAAKGLEFPVVFLPSVEQGILPHQRAISSGRDDEIEEERRLLFVGLTRAREELYLTNARQREFRGQMNYPIASMFLGELPPHLIDEQQLSSIGQPDASQRFRTGGVASQIGWDNAGVEHSLAVPPRNSPAEPYPVGKLVRHEQYGVGVIVGHTGAGATRTVKIRFKTAGERAFRVDSVKLEIMR
jgi:DNA helicase II / ATP-dependent DNA helicase PcrA